MFLICLVEYQHLWGGGERDNREGEGGICRDEWRPNTVQQLPGSWRIKIKAGGCRVMNVNLCTEIPGEVSIILQKTNLDLMATENLLLGHDQIEFTRCGHTKGWEQDGKHSLPSLPVGTSRPAALPRMSPRFSDSLYMYVRDCRLLRRSMRNRETDRQADKQRNDEWADVQNGEKERDGAENIRTQYVWIKREGGRGGGVRGRMGGRRAEKTGWRKRQEVGSDSAAEI